ncbi:uncharacterized protein LOC120327265 [Styela clava]|uniref:uncharacterized protein LOC120327265 n=1 Tax=Styela clava TaxID=7725 RepID=UPI0019395268|nr:uncharacterized protein LOC120327265 [Styela clava]
MATTLIQVLAVSVAALMMAPSTMGQSNCKLNGLGDCFMWQEITDCINGYFAPGNPNAACNTVGARCCQSYDGVDYQREMTERQSDADGLCTAANGNCRHFSNYCAGNYNGNAAHCAGYPARQCCV